MAQAPIDISKVIDTYEVFKADLAKNAGTVISELLAVNESSKKLQEAETGIGAANAVATRTKMEADLETRRLNAAASADVGMNPGASSYILSALSSSILQKEGEIRSRDTEIQKKLDVKFYDDPLSFLSNQLSAPFDIAARNVVAAQTQSMNSQMAEASKRFTEAAVVNAAIAETVTTKSIAAAAEKNLLEAQIKVASEQQNLARLNIHGATIRDAQDKQQWDAILALQSAQNAQQHLALSAAAGQRDAERLKMDKEMREIQMEERRDKQAAEKSIQMRLDKVADALSIGRIPVREFEHMPAAHRTIWRRMMYDPDVQERGVLGTTPVQVVDTANAMGLNLTPGMNIVRKKIIDVKNAVFADPQYATVMQHGKPEDRERIVNMSLEAQIKAEARNIPETGGIYSPPPLLATLAIPMISSLQLSKELQALAVNNPEYPTSASDIFGMGVKMMREGKANPASAATQMKMIFEGILSDNTTQRQYLKFAIPVPTTYKTNVQTGGTWGSSMVMDVTNFAQLEAEFTRVMARDAMNAAALGNKPNLRN